MKNLNLEIGIFIIMTLLMPGAFASAEEPRFILQMYNSKEKKYQNVEVIKTLGVHVSSNCKNTKESKTCMALMALIKNSNLRYVSSTPLAGNPAARNCYAFDAVNRILFDRDRKEFDYCVFPDGSMIDAWSLFYKQKRR